jgi:gliding motility-associated-like protein
LYTEEGLYDLNLNVLALNGCTLEIDSLEAITVWPKPVAGFKYLPKEPDLYSPDVRFTDLSNGAELWYWDFGDGNLSEEQEPEHIYSDTGTFIVEQIVENQYGCLDTAYEDLPIAPVFNIFVPNAFTPDGNGDNDVFIFKAFGIQEETLDFTIFDRWGDIMYHTNQNKPWDGTTVGGENAKQAVYIWKLSFRDVFNKSHTLQGHVTLIR